MKRNIRQDSVECKRGGKACDDLEDNRNAHSREFKVCVIRCKRFRWNRRPKKPARPTENSDQAESEVPVRGTFERVEMLKQEGLEHRSGEATSKTHWESVFCEMFGVIIIRKHGKACMGQMRN